MSGVYVMPLTGARSHRDDARPAFLATKLRAARMAHPGAYVIPCRACHGTAAA